MIDGPIASIPNDVERVVALVRRGAAEECAPDACLIHPVLDACARDAVSSLWDSRIKIFVPLLALRRVRCCIRAGRCDCGDC
ncbi:MAG: hypothetical protein ACR2MQ_09580 [Gemmatimonadaceae bacterium]